MLAKLAMLGILIHICSDRVEMSYVRIAGAMQWLIGGGQRHPRVLVLQLLCDQ